MTAATAPEDFLTALEKLQQECGVADLRMSDFGITPDECGKFARNAREVMGIMFTSDRIAMSDSEVEQIYRDSYR